MLGPLRSAAGFIAITLSSADAAGQSLVFDEVDDSGLAVQLAQHTPGNAVGDFDGDGWMDLAIFGIADRTPQLFRNNGAAIEQGAQTRWFTNVTPQWMPGNAEPSGMGMFADLDNDGDQDLVVVRRYVSDQFPLGNYQDTGIMYYVNKGGRFVRGQSAEDLARAADRPGGLALADTDKDGDLDIVFLHNGSGDSQGGPGFFIRNDGISRLVDATSSFGVPIGVNNRYFSCLLADFNGDTWADLHCAVDFYSDVHCHNAGNGTFIDVTAQVGATSGNSDMGLAIGDIENDGDMDIYSTNINHGVLYVNDGTGVFTQEHALRGVGSFGNGGTTIAWGTAFVDFDHDRDQDLVAVAFQNPGHIYTNDGAGYFTKASDGSGLFLMASGLIPFDFDNDGDQDLWVARTGNQTSSLYENVTPSLPGRHWLTVRMQGTQSNRDGVGARIQIDAGGVTQTRQIVAGYSFKSGPPMEAHFGLGEATGIDELRVEWPSGVVQVLSNVGVDQYLLVVEP